MHASGFAQRARKQLKIDKFSGFDFSESPISADKKRAINGKNFLMENGINQKRRGWDERVRITKDGVPQQINGVWHFSTNQYSDGTKTERKPVEFTIVHAGTGIYSVDLETQTVSLPLYSGASDERSYGIYNDGKLYLLCGDYLVFGQFTDSNYAANSGWEVRRVYNNTDSFIPTTTINIGYFGEKDDITKLYDKPNLLCSRRKNSFSTSVTETNDCKKYQVDTKKMDENLVVVTVLRLNSANQIEEEVYKNSSQKDAQGKTVWGATLTNQNEVLGGVNFAEGTINLNLTIPPLFEKSDKDNMIVEFSYVPRDETGKILENYEERITKCRFGTRFGNAGVDDRLFVAGNVEHPNLCFHSGINDFTYFSDEDVAVCGSDSSKINGFSRLGDGTLAIHKEANGQDVSIYYRTGETRTETEKDGTVKRTEIFPVRAGAIGEGVVSPWTCINFTGDNLMLSNNGVYGLVLSSNVATNERYARERSRTVNDKLLKHDLREAVAAAYQNKYYLAVEGECFVADARYTFRGEGDLADTFNYEWWFLENIPARVFTVIGNRLYFGSDQGRVCRFDEKYSDRTYQFAKDGEVTLSYEDNKFYINAELFEELKESDLVNLQSRNGMLFTQVVDKRYILAENDRVFASLSNVYIPENSTVYLDQIEAPAEVGINAGKPYFAKNITYDDFEKISFDLFDGDNPISFPSGITPVVRFRVCRCIENANYEIVNAFEFNGATSFQIRGKGEENILTPIVYNGTSALGIQAKLCFIRNVSAEWYTPMLDLGDNTLTKRLRSINIVTEPYISGKVKFGYVTKSGDSVDGSLGLSGFSFENIDFTDFTFNINNFATNYAKRVNERSLNFIMLRLISDTGENCAINSMGVEYSIVKKIKGVK